MDHEKGLSSNFSPYMRKCNHVIEYEYNGIGVVSCPIYLKADVLESRARFSQFRGLLCHSERGGVLRMCVGAVMR